MQAALGHQGNKTDGFQGDRLTAGVGAGDHQSIEGVPQLQIVSHRLFLVQQRVPCLTQAQILVRQFGLRALHLQGKLSPCKDTIQPHQQLVVLQNVLLVGRALSGQLGQNALDLLLLLGQQLPQLIVGLHHAHRLNEEGGAGGRHIVDQTGDGVLMLRLHRHHIPVGADGNDRFLEIFGLIGGDELLQDVPHLGLGGPHVAADGGQLTAGRVGQLILPYNGVGNGVLQKAVGGESVEEVGDGGFLLAVSVLLGGTGTAEHRRYLQQLPGVEAASHIRPVEDGPHRLDPGQAGVAPKHQHLHRRRGLLLGPLYVVQVGHRPQLEGLLLALLSGGTGRELLQHPGQLQSYHRFFKQVGHWFPPGSAFIQRMPYFLIFHAV